MHEQFSRTALLMGEAAVERLSRARVAVFGVGGVGALDLIDNDTVSPSNLNRQIIALHSTLGRLKVDVAAERVLDINPEIIVHRHPCFFLPENADSFDFSRYDYVVDAIDTIAGKLEIILRAQAAGVPVISSMGAGNKLDPSRFRVADIYDTKVCPLARAMRSLLRKKGVSALKVVYSEEEAVKTGDRLPGSVAFVPAAAGLVLAGEVIRDLAKEDAHGA